MRKLKKRPGMPTLDPLTVRPNGKLSGHELVMRRPTTAEWIRLKRGEIGNADMLDMIVKAVIDHTFTCEVDELDPLLVVQIGDAWFDAQKQESVPQAGGAT